MTKNTVKQQKWQIREFKMILKLIIKLITKVNEKLIKLTKAK